MALGRNIYHAIRALCEELVDPAIRAPVKGQSLNQMRASDWDLIREGHYAQR
jgi:hypothetical protein